MGTLFETAIVQKRNVLNELHSNNMTIQELRLFSIYLSKINSRDLSTRNVRFMMSDFQNIMGFGRLNIQQICDSTDKLMTKIVHIPIESGGFVSFSLFRRCRVDRDEKNRWFVELSASEEALPLMFDFKDNYFKYELWNALRLKSPNQVRMYEILKQYENLGRRELMVTDLRGMLGIAEAEYAGRTGWSDFRKNVLDSCQMALKTYTDICFTYERGLTGIGGKWISVIFYIKKNTEYQDPLSLEKFINMQPVPKPAKESQEEDSPAEDTPVPGVIGLPVQKKAAEDPEEYEEEDEKWKRIYGSERIVILAEACGYEFNKPQMEQLMVVLTRINIPADPLTNSILWGRHRYLCEKYAALNVEEQYKIQNGKNPIKNRFKYFLSMLEEDAYQPAAY